MAVSSSGSIQGLVGAVLPLVVLFVEIPLRRILAA